MDQLEENYCDEILEGLERSLWFETNPIQEEEEEEIQSFRVPFSLKDDLVLLKAMQTHFLNWEHAAEKVYDTPKDTIKLKNRFYTYTRRKPIWNSLLKILKDLESDASIEMWPTKIVEPFRMFVKVLKKKRKY